MKESIIQRAVSIVLGHKYYCNIVNVLGTDTHEMTSYIFSQKADAEAHRRRINSTLSFEYVETISFRSRKVYKSNIISK